MKTITKRKKRGTDKFKKTTHLSWVYNAVGESNSKPITEDMMLKTFNKMMNIMKAPRKYPEIIEVLHFKEYRLVEEGIKNGLSYSDARRYAKEKLHTVKS